LIAASAAAVSGNYAPLVSPAFPSGMVVSGSTTLSGAHTVSGTTIVSGSLNVTSGPFGSTFSTSYASTQISGSVAIVGALKFASGGSITGFQALPFTVSGSKGGNSALASLIQALAAFGLISDTTT
jgi:hypothetical protein